MENKVLLFKEFTNKIDLISNNSNQLLSVLDNDLVECYIDYSLDSNHMFYATLLCSENELYKKVAKKQIIKVLHQGSYDYFIIIGLQKGLDEILITARHWTTEVTLNAFLNDLKPRNLNSAAMMGWIKINSEEFKIGRQYIKDLNVGGNITSNVSTNFYHKSMYEAIGELQELYGSEIKREGFNLNLVDYVGSKVAKYKVEYAVNLLDNNQIETWDIATGCIAKGYNGICSDIVYSGLLTENPNLMGQTVEVETKVRVREEGKEDEDGYIYFDTESDAKTELNRIAAEQFTIVGIDKPKVSFDTKFIDLSTTEEYKDEIKVWINIGDLVNVKIVKYNNLDINVRVFSYRYNPLIQEIEDITLTNNNIKAMTPPTVTSVQKEVEKKPSINDVIETARRESEAIVNQGFNGFVHYKPNYTAWTDTQDIKQSKNGLCANKNGWFFYRDGIDPNTGVPNPSGATMIADIIGNFYADAITAGTLNANLIRAGIIKDIAENMIINLDSGEINFSKGIINGLNLKLDLNKGLFETWGLDESDREGRISIGGSKLNFSNWGKIECNNHLNIYGGVKNGESGSSLFLGRGENGAGVATLHSNTSLFLSCNSGEKIIEMRDDFINIEAPRVLINWAPIQTQVANLENVLLQKEGLI